ELRLANNARLLSRVAELDSVDPTEDDVGTENSIEDRSILPGDGRVIRCFDELIELKGEAGHVDVELERDIVSPEVHQLSPVAAVNRPQTGVKSGYRLLHLVRSLVVRF